MNKIGTLKIAAFAIILLSSLFYYCEKEKLPGSNPPGAVEPDTVVTPFPVKQVKIVNYTFTPKTLVIMRNTSVNWTNKDSVTHTVSHFDGAFDSGDLLPASNFFFTFRQPGVFDYYCKRHKETGKLIVQ